ILPDQWSSQKAKLLLKYLIQTRARGYADKERLIEFLWPESSSSKASHRLQVTLSTLRKILNSTISEKGASDQYIKRKGNGYLLTLGETGWLDCDRFLNEIKAAEENQEMYVEHLLRAETLYGGDYMLGDPYIDAFENQREFFREKYLRVLQNLIDHFEAVSDVEKCVKYAESFLKHDPYNESLYRALMRFHAVSGNRSKIRQTYQNCVKFLDSGLDASPGPETNTLYQELIK
ncbi:hypothetical protein KKA14_17405, partial [bacterium]|nr:hypothetical protein [bacterium]